MANAWHDISIGEEAPNKVNCVIEITKGSKGKYELDKESGMLMLDRVLYTPMTYPANYGFIPRTYCDDKDPLDALVLCQVDILPMALLEITPIGVMHMIDQGEGDDKIIAVASNDPSLKHIKDISDLPETTLNEIKLFFEDYKKLEKKEVQVSGFKGRETALEVIKESQELYAKNF
jgi:inorganic pyrophosphatase